MSVHALQHPESNVSALGAALDRHGMRMPGKVYPYGGESVPERVVFRQMGVKTEKGDKKLRTKVCAFPNSPLVWMGSCS